MFVHTSMRSVVWDKLHNSCYWSWACGQILFCFKGNANEAKGSIQCRIDPFASFVCQTADNYRSDSSYCNLPNESSHDLHMGGKKDVSTLVEYVYLSSTRANFNLPVLILNQYSNNKIDRSITSCALFNILNLTVFFYIRLVASLNRRVLAWSGYFGFLSCTVIRVILGRQWNKRNWICFWILRI